MIVGSKDMKIRDQKLEDFLTELASKSPTPGGGAVAAVAGAMAASLVEMVCNLTIGKRNYEDVAGSMQQVARKAKTLRWKFLNLADEDVRAFNEVMTAYQSKFKSKSKIKKALERATEVPEETAKLASEVEKIAEMVAGIGNKNAISDAKTAGYLAKAAFASGVENVKINKNALARLK